jgi:hypothetical protein
MTIYSSLSDYINRNKRERRLQFLKQHKAYKLGIRNNIYYNNESERRRRKSMNVGNWVDSTWSKMLTDVRYRDPSSPEGKLFRSRFRVPYPKFLEICRICRDSGKFNKAERDCCLQKTVPLEILILGALRVLGRGLCMDDISEMSNVSQEVHRVFFHKFCKFMSENENFL